MAWFPWGEEAFAEARRRDVPILVSIGYSTCYWCHVMERESFENDAIAAVINAHVVPIKVDREERPDVDELYMTACQVFTQLTEGRPSGGWPLNAFLDPHTLRPFFVGTYFPPRPGHGRPAFTELVTALGTAWRDRREEVVAQADQLAAFVAQQLSATTTKPIDHGVVDAAVASLMQMHDRTHGGFGGGPKFPQPPYLFLLLETGWENATIRDALIRTADAMAIGGLFDQVGGGFHRYCVDGTWTVPHFEKMLYDNGQLASFYAELIDRRPDPFHARVLRRTLDWALAEMATGEDLFCSAQDAEVDAREGASFLWTPSQVRSALEEAGRADLVDFASTLYGLDRRANFRDPHHPDAAPSWVLRLAGRPETVATSMGIAIDEFEARRAEVDRILKPVRDRRPQPMTDDKALTAWNGLMIAGLADGGRVLDEPRYIDAAVRGAEAVLRLLGGDDGTGARGIDEDGAGGSGLFRVRRGGASRIHAFLEDYALLARGLIALHRATGELGWTDAARRVVDAAEHRFADGQGGWFDTLEGQGDLFVRSASIEDGAVPSGGGAMALALLELAEIDGSSALTERAAAAIARRSGRIADHPAACALSVMALDRLLARAPERLTAALDAGKRPGRLLTVEPTAGDTSVRLAAEAVHHDPATRTARLEVVLSIPAGFHVNAHDADDPDLIGLSIERVESGAAAQRERAIDVAYPAGEPFGEAGAIRVHEGELRVPVTLAEVDPVERVILAVTFQACTDRECLRPERRMLEVVLPGRA